MKKSLIISAALLVLLMSSSYACDQYEAQFAGKVTKATIISEDKCLIDMEMEHYASSFLCPLLEEDVQSKKITIDADKCDSSIIGSKLYGVLYLDRSSRILIE
jgi:hypothetical protein